MNYNQGLLLAAQKKKLSGEFGYGMGDQDFGSAVADQIIDDANKSWTDAQLQSAKAKWREMVLNLQNAVASRNEAIAAIKAMPAGAEKDLAVGQFNDAESIFMDAYGKAQPIFAQIGSLTGDNFPATEAANFGIAPAIWALAAASLVAIAYISTAMYESHLKYDAIKTNPAVAPYVQSGGLFSSAGVGLSSGLKYGIIALAVLIGASMVMKKAV